MVLIIRNLLPLRNWFATVPGLGGRAGANVVQANA
jgi:hypothetical protein